jgi:flagellar hook-associated protein FlgK
MSDILNISSNAVNAYQSALTTVSNNIANVDTEGYSRQEVVMQDTAPAQHGNAFIGTGVVVQQIQRDFDNFIEQNLRNSDSDLSTQTPIVNIANQVMNVMGDKNLGLSSALDSFFSSASALAADPGSTIQRNSYLQSANSLTARFATVSSQVQTIAAQATGSLADDVSQFNTLTSQLAVINQNLMQKPTLEAQPAQLLDSRDLTLEKLSKLLKVNATFSSNGVVSVSLGSDSTQNIVVDPKGKSYSIGTQTDAEGQPNLVYDPYGKNQPVPIISSGEIAGYQQVISQVVNSTQKNINQLAQTFVKEANAIQTGGIDGYGTTGQNLFSIDPNATNAAAGVSVVLSDPQRVAAASQFSVTPGSSNVGTASASVAYTGTTPTAAVSNSMLVNNPNPSASVNFSVDGASVYTPVTDVAAGVQTVIYMNSSSPGQQLQVLTQDGQQLLGQALTQTQQYQMLTASNGFNTNSKFSTQYLNQSGVNAYRGEDLFYGAKASTLQSPVYDNTGRQVGTTPLPAQLQTSRLSSLQNIPSGAMQLNGVSLAGFQANNQSSALLTGLTLVPSGTGPNFAFNLNVGGQKIDPPIILSPDQVTDMTTLQSNLSQSLQCLGLDVRLVNNGQDLKITDPQGRNLTGISLAPVTGATISGITFPSTQAAPFTFNFQANGKAYTFGNFSASNVNDLASQLNAQMAQSGLQGVSVQPTTDGAGIQISDALGRDITSAYFSTTSTNPAVTTGTTVIQGSAGANAATVTLNTDAQQVSQWLNGSSQATFSGVQFDAINPLAFAQFSATIGGTNFTFNNLASTNLSDLAAELQMDLRTQDSSSSLTVQTQGNTLQITDSQGRVMSGFSLTPAADDQGASGGTVDITQSTQHLTGVHAEVTSTITVPSSQIKTSLPLSINGQSISGYQSIPDLVTAINAKNAGVVAALDTQGNLVLTDPLGGAIGIDSLPTANALGLGAGVYSPQVNMVRAVPSMTLPATGLDFGKALTVNGVNMAQASYSLPAAGTTSFMTSFGTIDQSSYDPATLQATLNDKSSQSLTGISFGSQTTPNPNMFQSFAVQIGDRTFNVNNLNLTSASLSDLASQIQDSLRKQDNSTNITVSADSTGTQLTVSDGSVPARAVSNIQLTATMAGLNAQASTGNVQARFSDSYVASVSGQTLTVTSLNSNMTDGQIASSLYVHAGTQQLQSLSSVTDKQSLLARFASMQSATGVIASLDNNGDIVLTTTDPTAQATISIGPGQDSQGKTIPNMLGVAAQDYDPSKRLQMAMSQDPTFNSDIRMSFGTYGTPPDVQSGDPSMMQSLGLRTAAYIQNGSLDNLKVFVTGQGSAQVSASYTNTPADQLTSLRSQSLAVKFTSDNTYNILDSKTNTVLASRTYDPNQLPPEVSYDGLNLTLSSSPTVGDTYAITGNSDGSGNNIAMLQMAALSKKPVINNKTIVTLVRRMLLDKFRNRQR